MTTGQDEAGHHMIPSHFFERGEFEVWAPRYEWRGGRFTGRTTMQKIAGDLNGKTASVMKRGWPGSEVREAGRS